MKRINIPRDPAAHNSRLIRRPIQRMVWLFLLPTFAAFCIGFLYPFFKGAVSVLLQVQADQPVDMGWLQQLHQSALRTAASCMPSGTRRCSPSCRYCIINVLAFTVAYVLTQRHRAARTFSARCSSCRTSSAASCWATSGRMIFDGFLVKYNTSVVLERDLRLLGPHHPYVLAAGRLYDDHLHRRTAVHPGGHARGGPH